MGIDPLVSRNGMFALRPLPIAPIKRTLTVVFPRGESDSNGKLIDPLVADEYRSPHVIGQYDIGKNPSRQIG
ncbi:MAG: hypothetical protein AAFO01_16090, partial [Pseudomonadota bacterium]